MCHPWTNWIPGVLSTKQVKELVKGRYLSGFDDESAFDYSSVDLHLTDQAYRLKEGSIKPSGGRYLGSLESDQLIERFEKTDNAYRLEPRKTYLFKLQEMIAVREPLQEMGLHGQATAKSSIGRLDILARLVVDGANKYEGFDKDSLGDSTGEMFLEITPMTFPITLRSGDSLTQLRFFCGHPEIAELRGSFVSKVLLDGNEDSLLSVNLMPAKITESKEAAAFRAVQTEAENCIVDLGANPENYPAPEEYWHLENADDNRRLRIQAGSFYIIRSWERITVPKGIAVYCRAIDETLGEMRIHYAGFVHPFFGMERSDGERGTPLIFEVRGHDVDVNLIHKEKMAKLIFYRMSEDAEKRKIPEKGTKPKKRTNIISSTTSTYANQTLQLSKYFGEWNGK